MKINIVCFLYVYIKTYSLYNYKNHNFNFNQDIIRFSVVISIFVHYNKNFLILSKHNIKIHKIICKFVLLKSIIFIYDIELSFILPINF